MYSGSSLGGWSRCCVLVVVTYRDDELDRWHPLRPVLEVAAVAPVSPCRSRGCRRSRASHGGGRGRRRRGALPQDARKSVLRNGGARLRRRGDPGDRARWCSGAPPASAPRRAGCSSPGGGRASARRYGCWRHSPLTPSGRWRRPPRILIPAGAGVGLAHELARLAVRGRDARGSQGGAAHGRRSPSLAEPPDGAPIQRAWPTRRGGGDARLVLEYAPRAAQQASLVGGHRRRQPTTGVRCALRVTHAEPPRSCLPDVRRVVPHRRVLRGGGPSAGSTALLRATRRPSYAGCCDELPCVPPVAVRQLARGGARNGRTRLRCWKTSLGRRRSALIARWHGSNSRGRGHRLGCALGATRTAQAAEELDDPGLGSWRSRPWDGSTTSWARPAAWRSCSKPREGGGEPMDFMVSTAYVILVRTACPEARSTPTRTRTSARASTTAACATSTCGATTLLSWESKPCWRVACGPRRPTSRSSASRGASFARIPTRSRRSAWCVPALCGDPGAWEPLDEALEPGQAAGGDAVDRAGGRGSRRGRVAGGTQQRRRG